MNKKVINLTLLFSVFSVSSQGLTALQRSIYLFDMGMKKDTYGYLLFLAAGILLVMQLILGPWSDRGKNRKTIIIAVFAFVNLLGVLGFAVFHSMFVLSVALIFAVIGFGTTFNMMRTLTAAMSTSEETSTNFARLQLTCGASYAVFAAAYGYILDLKGFNGLFTIATALTVLSVIVSILLLVFVDKLDLPISSEPKYKSLASAYKFDKKVIVIMVLYLFVTTAQQGGFNYILYFMKEIGGASDKMAGWILSIEGFVEIPMMYFTGRYCKKHKKERLIIPFLLIGASRWILLLLVANPIWFFLIHSMQAFLLSAMFIAMGALVMDHVPASRAGAAIGLMGAISSIGMAVGPAIMGAVTASAGVKTGMIVMAVMLILPTIAFAVYAWKSMVGIDDRMEGEPDTS